MRVYIVTYRYLADVERGLWSGENISQEGYETIEEAQQYISSRTDHPVKVNDWYFQTQDGRQEYCIRDILVRTGVKGRVT